MSPKLYEVDLTLSSPSLSRRTTDALSSQVATRPTALRLKNACHWRRCPFEAAYQLGSAWQDSLEFVVLSGEPFCFLSLPPTVPFQGNLKEFQWAGLDRPSQSVLEWWLGKAQPEAETTTSEQAEAETPPVLKYLSFDFPPDSMVLSRMIHLHSASLRSLRLSDLSDVDRDVLKECRGLEEFSLDQGMDEGVLRLVAGWVSESKEDSRESTSVKASTSSTTSPLSHLEFGVQAAESTALLAVARRVIAEGKLRRLTTVTIKHAGDGPMMWRSTPGPSIKWWRESLSALGVSVVDAAAHQRLSHRLLNKVSRNLSTASSMHAKLLLRVSIGNRQFI